tara:strand:- start:89 stop:967 length:879 start_codon:yes stop_codon:yes gene_type:complete
MKVTPKNHQRTLAIVYDFDGTLTPLPMQEYTVLPELGIDSSKFWAEVEREVKITEGDPILTYMRLLVEKIEAKKAHLSRESLRELAGAMQYYPGVETWFDRINEYVAQSSGGTIETRHYIISAGLKEILEGITIKKHFNEIYASQYYFDHHEAARFPTIVINDTAKTQYLFRINKGRETYGETINEYMPESIRPIPFENMLYIGDGLTDVPCMTVMKNYGGFSVAVHGLKDPNALETCRKLAAAERIDFYAPADYREDKVLEKRVHKILQLIIARINFETERKIFLQKTTKG